MYEVELKFPVSDASRLDTGPAALDSRLAALQNRLAALQNRLAALQNRLAALGAKPVGTVSQLDRYFNHPCRDFAVTDEALRLRSVGREVELTYKGPRIDAVTKTRRECSLPLPDRMEGDAAGGTVEAWTELLLALGFRQVAEVVKDRSSLTLGWQGHHVEVAIDSVRGLGTYVELEVLSDDAGVDAARDCLIAFAEALGLSGPERRSYLELLLAARAASPRSPAEGT